MLQPPGKLFLGGVSLAEGELLKVPASEMPGPHGHPDGENHRPAEEFVRLEGMLRPGGWLALMTCFQDDDERFEAWHYRLDPTHVVFYRESTLRFIARSLRLACEIPVKDVVLMRKPLRHGIQSSFEDCTLGSGLLAGRPSR
jgi:hypothetical protein